MCYKVLRLGVLFVMEYRLQLLSRVAVAFIDKATGLISLLLFPQSLFSSVIKCH